MKEYLVLARKYRPQKFSEVVGQEHITKTLQNALKEGKIAHSYLFTGPRGVGKTTVARILSKALNCEKGVNIEPCNECTMCREITNGRSQDVLEIDGASNRRIEEIRNLKEGIGYAPIQGRYKVYIVDEVHMLTNEAFNALLKTLEVPPPHTIFIFATTEPYKVPLTILSRCQRFDFRKLTTREIYEHIKKISDIEGIKILDEAIRLISERADGALRDAEVMLDQLRTYTDEEVTEKDVKDVFGFIDKSLYKEIMEGVK
jgi:DNA polymerase-3 subunit gamma/tau